MNANELADKAESMKKYGYTDGWIDEVATKLRQQQAEIEALKKEVEKYKPKKWTGFDVGNGEIRYL